ncbi:DNA polymerase III subunit delta [Aurantimonas sp. Leaf443]|uniref:DNA polymerase III subunit delta n=1 Tax=Aurantimonas sp. Leaf443 TaxID=1736378 RepID=UPI0006FD8E9E|nr:DNA polymerase III subunit delta [Aurantimonas sp. Leaf443]KQT85535.1 DNA polymerase III subunit delta [Aurantimonas sp. Leaf443]
MAQKKAGEVDAFLSRPDTSFPVVLLYGPDAGLVSERAEKIAALSGVDASDPFAVATLTAEEAERDIGRLFDEVGTISMFGGRRLIRVRAGSGAMKALSEAVVELGARPPKDALLVIEAGDLKKSAPLRVAAEKGRAAMALPCYPDEGRALDQMIDEELREAHLSIDRDARDSLRARLGADRRLSRGEVRKLCVYAYGMDKITDEMVRDLVGDVSADTLDETIDATVGGEVKRLPHLIERMAQAGGALFPLQQGLLRYFQQLQAMRELVERHGETVGRVVERARPHFRRKAAMEAALGAWPLEAISQLLRRIEADILAARREAALAETITRRLMMDIAVETARRRTRG